MTKEIVIVLKIVEYPAEILNRNAKFSIGKSSWIRHKTNKTSSSNHYCRFGPGFFWENGFDGLKWYLLVVSILFPLKYWIWPCLGLRRLIIKSKAAAVGQSVYNLTLIVNFFTYFNDHLGQDIPWCWCSLEMQVLLVIDVGSCSGVVEIDNGSFLGFLIYQSRHFQFH